MAMNQASTVLALQLQTLQAALNILDSVKIIVHNAVQWEASAVGSVP